MSSAAEMTTTMREKPGIDHSIYVQRALDESDEHREWEVVCATDRQLLLDYDQSNWDFIYQTFIDAKDILDQRFPEYGNVNWKTYRSRSNNYHVVVELPEDMSVHERIAWQAAFGSDPKREALHLLSVKRGDINPIVLVMRKDRDEKKPAGERKFKTIK